MQRAVQVFSLCLLLGTAAAQAHFQVILPDRDVVPCGERMAVKLDILFTHPMEQGPVMQMGTPSEFGVLYHGNKHDLLNLLTPHRLEGKTAFTCTWSLPEPADYVFYIAPAPYWEPAEEKMIIHYTKVVVDACEAEEGWDSLVGLPVEIKPLVRPYGLWTGNEFRGVVLHHGRPVPYAEIEVEYWNAGRRVQPPCGPFVTQVIKADGDGVFSYCMPRAGWWGFAALVEGEPMRNPEGETVETELGGLIWVRVQDMP